MALVDTGVISLWLFGATQRGASPSSMLLDAAGEKAAMIVKAPKTGTISAVHWRVGAITTFTSTDVRIETVSTADGNPTGTLWGPGTNGTQASATANSFLRTPLTAGASVNRGDVFAVVIAPSGVPNYNVVRAYSEYSEYGSYTDYFTTAWAKDAGLVPILALEYSDGSILVPIGCISFINGTALNIHSGSTPNEVGVKVTFPFKCRIVGVHMPMSSTANSAWEYRLYDSASNLITSVALDGDIPERIGYFPASYVVSPNETIRLTVKPTTTAYITITPMVTPNYAALYDNFPLQPRWTQRTGAGAWTERTDQFLRCRILIDQLDDGVGGGGLARIIGG